MTTTTDPDPRTALLARLRSLEGIIHHWGGLIHEHDAASGYCRGMRDRAQAELAAVRQALERLEREGVAG